MKKRLLLIFSLISLVAALTLALAIPILAGSSNGASIDKVTVNNGNGTLTSTLSVKNNNSTATITITSITDSVYHKGGLPNPELSGQLLPGGNPVTVAAGDTYSVPFTYQIRTEDYGHNVQDVCYVSGTNNANDPPINEFTLSYPDQFGIPLSELSAGALFGFGAVGLGGFVWLNRRKSTAKV
jgi:hypothetical protein